MAKRDADKDTSEVAEMRARLGRGEQLPAGWTFNPDRDPDVYKATDEELAVANGELSVSWDGRIVTNLATGQVEMRDQPDEFKIARPVTLAEVAEAGGATSAVASAAGDRADTGGGAGATTGGTATRTGGGARATT
jgi:hypothetical protein